MQFSGPTSKEANWAGEGEIRITFDSVDELAKNHEKYLRARHAIVRTSPEARPGDRKTLLFLLPNGSRLTLQGEIEKVKEQPDRASAVALFKLLDMSGVHLGQIEAALKPQADDLDMGDDLDGLLSGANVPPPKEAPTARAVLQSATAPTPAAKPAARSNEENEAVMALLNEEDPDDGLDLSSVELPDELKGAGGDLIMPKKEGDEPDPFMEQKKFVVAFVLAFTKSVQRTGYYGDMNHPEAIKARKGLYLLFRKIVGKNREINFIRKAVGNDRDVLVDGVLSEMVALKEIMPHGMCELYIPRLLEYLERRCLISFSVKRNITEEKFNKFLALLSMYSPEFRDDARREGERFTKTLVDSNIYEVSAIFDEDIIASGRKLPWQAELTLSRLRKDLKMVPLLKNATEDELRQIKVRIFTDTIRPLRNPSFLIVVLLNSDLIQEAIEDNPVLKDINVESFMILGAEMVFLAKSSHEIVKELEGVREIQKRAPLEVQRKQAADQERVLSRILKYIGERFLNEKHPSADEALEHFHERGLMTLEELPVRIQEKIGTRKLVEGFLQNHQTILAHFNTHLSDVDFADFLTRFQRVVPQLSARKELLLVGRLVEAVGRHLDDRDARRKMLAKRFFDYIATTDVLNDLKAAFYSEDKDLRQLAANTFVSFGRQAVPMLLDILKNHSDKWVRKTIIKCLTDIGPGGLQVMINELYKEGNPWYFLRNLVKILGELGDRKIVGKMTLLLYHQNPRVREETIDAIFRIAPDVAETHLIKALEDAEARVREKAVACLGSLKSHNEKVMRFYTDVLEGRSEEENEPLQVQVYRAVSLMTNLDDARRRGIENALLARLEKVYGAGGVLGFLRRKGGGGELSDGLKVAICVALGAIGSGKRVRSVLEQASRERDPILAQRAKDALDSIRKREK